MSDAVAERDVIVHDHPRCGKDVFARGATWPKVSRDEYDLTAGDPRCGSCGRLIRGLTKSFVDGAMRAYS